MKRQPPLKKSRDLYSFFPKVNRSSQSTNRDGILEGQPSTPIDQNPQILTEQNPPLHNEQTPTSIEQSHPISSPGIENPPSSTPEVETSASIVRDPGMRKPLYEHHISLVDEIRAAYLKLGPYQPKLVEYPKTKGKSQTRRFQKKWFSQFSWLEYSPTTNKAYCFYCFLFQIDSNPSKSSALVTVGYDKWKRVDDGAKCVFLTHGRSSHHKLCEIKGQNLMKTSQHIEKVMDEVSREEVEKRRLRVKTSFRSARLLAFQGCAFRGHDESSSSVNRGNFIEVVKFTAESNPEIDKVVLQNAPKNAQYIAPSIQKEMLHIMASRVRRKIREEVGDECFCILVDEAQDAANREQMAIILRFVNSEGILTERFFHIKSVSDTTSANLKTQISDVLAHHELSVKRIRGQGYDGASNMRGAWNGLQALFLRECPYAYYVHCFAHRLQSTLVSAAKDVDVIWKFFSHLENIINSITSSPKRVNGLQVAQREHLKHLLVVGECESGSGANQMGNLHRPGATRWSSHYESIKSLINMYNATCKMFDYLSINLPKGRSRAESIGAYKELKCFEFVFCLHLLQKIMGITDILCQNLQRKSQDILDAMKFVSITKELLQKLRDDGWEEFFEGVKSFCFKNEVEIPNLNSQYKIGPCRSRHEITVEHHYHVEVFNETIDFVLMELNTRFNDTSVELLSLSAALNPAKSFESFNSRDICTLAEKFYSEDFSRQDICALGDELKFYEIDMKSDTRFQVSSLVELCRVLIESGRSETYIMVTKLIRLILILPVSTATTERAFSAMKHVKTELRNKMEDDFLSDCMTLNVERELAEKIDLDSLVDEFYISKPRREQLQIK